MAKTIYVDIGLCSECKGCMEIAPEIFRYNEMTGFMEATDDSDFDEALALEAMKNCPKKCIHIDGDDDWNCMETVESKTQKLVSEL